MSPTVRRVLRDGLVLVAGGFVLGAAAGAGVGWVRAQAEDRPGR